MAEMDRKAIEETHIDEATARGMAQGRAEGEAKGRADAARNLLRMGLELSKISEVTGLSLDELKGLMAEE